MIAVLFTPILTRLFDAEAFGIVAVFASVVSIFGAIACFRYEQAIVTAKSHNMALCMFVLGICIAKGLSVVILIAGIFGHDLILNQIGLASISAYFWLIPLNILIIGLHSSFNLWNTRHKQFSIVSAATITGGLATTFFNVVFGLLGYNTGKDLVLAAVIGQSSAVLVFAVLSYYAARQKNYKKPRLEKIKTGLIRYKKFPLYSSWAILMGASAWLLPTILMGIFFDPRFVGLYALGFKIIQMPTSFIGSAIGQVFFEASKNAKKTGKLGETVETLTASIIAVFIFPYLALLIIGAEFYAVVFGQDWWKAGLYSQILAPWAFVWFLSSPLTPLFSVLERQKSQLIWNIFNIISRLSPVGLAVYFDNFDILIWSLGIIGFFLYGYKVILSINIADASVLNILKLTSKNLIFCFLASLVLYGLGMLELHLFWKILFCIFFAFINLFYFYRSQSFGHVF